MSVDAIIRERVCSHWAVAPAGRSTVRGQKPPCCDAPVTRKRHVVHASGGRRHLRRRSLEHAVPAHPAAVTAAHTPKNARMVAIDPYWLVVPQDSSVAANALADGGVDGRRSKWSVANGLGGARPPDRSRPLPTMSRGGRRLKMSVNRAADVHGGPVSVGRGTRWVSYRYWSEISLALSPRFGGQH